MKLVRFEDIIAWQKAQELAVEIYAIFKKSRDYGFKDQILRSTVSISNNIAEGFERRTDTDFARFLYISLGSCSETKSMLHLAVKLGYLKPEQQESLIERLNEISRLTNGLIRSLKSK